MSLGSGVPSSLTLHHSTALRRTGCTDMPACERACCALACLSWGKTVWPWPLGRLFRYCRQAGRQADCQRPLLRLAFCGLWLVVSSYEEEGDEPPGRDGVDLVGLVVIGAHVVVQAEPVVAPVPHHLLQTRRAPSSPPPPLACLPAWLVAGPYLQRLDALDWQPDDLCRPGLDRPHRLVAALAATTTPRPRGGGGAPKLNAASLLPVRLSVDAWLAAYRSGMKEEER